MVYSRKIDYIVHYYNNISFNVYFMLNYKLHVMLKSLCQCFYYKKVPLNSRLFDGDILQSTSLFGLNIDHRPSVTFLPLNCVITYALLCNPGVLSRTISNYLETSHLVLLLDRSLFLFQLPVQLNCSLRLPSPGLLIVHFPVECTTQILRYEQRL